MKDSRGTSFFDAQPLFILDHESLDILDANEAATDLYGYAREELKGMNVNDLGEKKKRVDLIQGSLNGTDNVDKIWIHETKGGDLIHVQFTHHAFFHEGKPVKIAIAHDVSMHVEEGETNRLKFPQFVTHRSNYPLAELEWDDKMRVRSWSEKAEELLGWSEQEVIGSKDFFEELVVEEEREIAKQNIDSAVANHKAHFSVEGKVKTKSGEVLICKWYNSIIYDEHDNLHSIHSLVSDISGRKQSENLFRVLSEKSLMGVYLIQDDEFKYVNPRFAEIVGYSREKLLSSVSPLDLVHPEDQDLVSQNISNRLKGEGKTQQYDFRGISQDGQVIHVSVYGSVVKYMGKPAVIGTLVDTTSAKEATQKYWDSLESFQDLFDSINDAIFIQDEDGYFIEVNKGGEKMFGYDHDFFIGKKTEALVAPGKVDMIEMNEHFKKALGGTPKNLEVWGKRKNGEVFPIEFSMNAGSYFGQDVVITIARDTGDRHEAEEELRKNEEMFRQLFLNSPIPIALMDKRQDIRMVNSAFEDTFGYNQDEIKGLNIDKLIVPDYDAEMAQRLSNTVFSGETVHDSGRRLCKDGSLVDVLIYGLPVIVDGRTVAIFGLYIDITDRKQAEEKVKKSLKEKEVLLAEIHHRVKNNLAVITGLLELQSYNTGSTEATDVLRTSQMRINSIALIHEKLYQNEDLSEISFDVYIEQLTDVIASSMNTSQTNIDIDIDADPVKLTIGQAIPCALMLNEVITNAYKHAFPEQEHGEIDILLHQDGDDVTMKITDNGEGIPESVNLENPSSLGIQLIRTLSKQLEGEVDFYNTEQGTEFKLQFDLKE